MTVELNPYEAPQSPVDQAPEALAPVPAERWRRCVNMIVDYFVLFLLRLLLARALAVFGGASGLMWLQRQPRYLVALAITIIYYVALEMLFGRTLGKLVTGTKVVDAKGNAPGIGQVIGRTLCRHIPFEAFSFFSQDARGWHDSIPRTYVVKTR